jgi:hypothetical protein
VNIETKIALGFVFGLLVLGFACRDWKLSIKIALVLVLYEGAIRKWILPQASDLVYFAKDVFLIGAYFRYFTEKRSPLWKRWPPVPVTAIQVCAVIVLLGALNPNIGSVCAALLGAKGYLLYVPLLFVVPALFRNFDELRDNLVWYMLLTIPIGLLGILQFKSDRFSVLNTYAGGVDAMSVSMITGSGTVRITGTFSYLSGHVVYTCVFFALNVALICTEGIRFRRVLTFVSLPLLVANAFMGGSRAAVAVQVFVALGFLITLLISASGRLRRSLIALSFAGTAIAFATTNLFPDALDASMGRMMNSSDSFYGRTVESPISHVNLAYSRVGLIGAGIGTTTPAVSALRSRLNLPPIAFHPGYYDGEMSQVMAELGLMGFGAWYSLRLLVIVSILRAYRTARSSVSKPLALAALLLAAPYFLLSLVLNPVAGVLVWAMCGIGMTGFCNASAGTSTNGNKSKPVHRHIPSRMRAA